MVPVEPGTYFVDADLDPSTPLRVVYDLPAEGWSSWIGAAKFGPDDGHVGVSITTVVNLVTHGCRNHFSARPSVGPTVDDLATALSELEPFEVTSPPRDVDIYGYRGKHLGWTVPEMTFGRCDHGDLRSWIAPMDAAEVGDAFYGYTGPGYREEFWILDVEGTRLMIAAERSPGSPAEDLAELRAILDSIRIEPCRACSGIHLNLRAGIGVHDAGMDETAAIVPELRRTERRWATSPRRSRRSSAPRRRGLGASGS
ncbi:MAG: hypothetical protein U0V56_13555 [Actinomycetota bacterium]